MKAFKFTCVFALAVFLRFRGFEASIGNALDLSSYETQILSTGTTICGVRCIDGVVLGADSRSTSGPIVADPDKQKIRQLAPTVLVAGAGTSADCEHISRQVAHILALSRVDDELGLGIDSKNAVGTDSIAYTLKLIRTLLHGENFGGIGGGGGRGRKPEAVFILGGVECSHSSALGGGLSNKNENENGNFQTHLYRIERDGSSQPVSFAALGSGGPNALSVLESELFARGGEGKEPPPICTEEAVLIVRNAIRSGILNDLGSGSHVDLCVITKEGIQRWRERGGVKRARYGRNQVGKVDRTDVDAEDRTEDTAAEGAGNLDDLDMGSLGECVHSFEAEERERGEIFGFKGNKRHIFGASVERI